MRGPGRAVGLLTAALLLGLVTSCTTTPPRAAPTSGGSPSGSPRPNGMQIEAGRQAMVQRVLHRREVAVRHHDERAFLADVDPGQRALRQRQRQVFANLVRLPLATFTLSVDGSTWPAAFAARRYRATAYIPYVEQRLQLRGFDPAPVTSTYGLTFARLNGRWRIVSDDDVASRESANARTTPWDLTRIVVRRSPHALGIFDAGSEPSADRLMAWTEQSVRTVDAAVPLQWRGDVVVYALSSQRLLRRLGTRFLDRAAIAFPVLDDSDHPTRRVSTRVLINPRFLPRTEAAGSYLLTHEITHVALASTNGGTPTWVQEGLADYVATHGADPARWVPGPSSVARARRGAAAMPTSTFFGDADPAFEYDLSLAACAYLAHRFGEPRLWAFLRRLAADAHTDGDAEGHVDPVLRSMFGLDSVRLAHRAAALVASRGR